MTDSQKILEFLTDYINKYPEIRFGQALFNLDINEFADKINPDKKDFLLRDIYNDSNNKILNRILKSKENSKKNRLFELLIKLDFSLKTNEKHIIFFKENYTFLFPNGDLQDYHYLTTRRQLDMNGLLNEKEFDNLIYE